MIVEQRRFKRFKTKATGAICNPEASEISVHVHVIDVGAQGAQVKSRKPLPKGSCLDVFLFDSNSNAIHRTGRVVHSRQQDGLWFNGLQFDSIGGEDLQNWLNMEAL